MEIVCSTKLQLTRSESYTNDSHQTFDPTDNYFSVPCVLTWPWPYALSLFLTECFHHSVEKKIIFMIPFCFHTRHWKQTYGGKQQQRISSETLTNTHARPPVARYHRRSPENITTDDSQLKLNSVITPSDLSFKKKKKVKYRCCPASCVDSYSLSMR